MSIRKSGIVKKLAFLKDGEGHCMAFIGTAKDDVCVSRTFLSSKECRMLAAWLIRAADWLDWAKGGGE